MLAHNLPREGEGEAKELEPRAAGRLGEIDTPTLVIVGDKDQPDIIASSRILAERIRGARLEVMSEWRTSRTWSARTSSTGWCWSFSIRPPLVPPAVARPEVVRRRRKPARR